MLVLFVLMGSVCAVDVNDASNTEDSNLTNDDAVALSQEKLEVSSEDSISETNIVISHDDNLKDCPEDSVLKSSDESYYEDNGEQKLGIEIDNCENISISVDDSKLNSYANEEVLTASKVSTSLSVSDTYYDNSATCFKVTLKDKSGNGLSKQKISLKVNGKTYTGTTNNNGIASIKTTALAVGTYTVSVSYAGSSSANASSLSKKVSVKKDKTKITGRATTYILPYNYYTYEVTLTSENGGPVKNCKVYFSYAGKTVSANTNSEGKASVVIPLLDVGTYKITYKFEGTSGYYSSSSSGTIHIKEASNKLTASDLRMTYNDGSKFSVKLTDTKGKALSGKTISFILNDKVYSAKTDSKGIAKLPITGIKPGTYKIKYLYSTLGESEYNYGYKNVYIYKYSAKISAKDLSMKRKESSQFKITLKDASGNVLKYVYVKFTVNGKTYSQKTDANGVAKLTISLPVGYYSIKTVVASPYYQGTSTKHILVNGVKFSAGGRYVTTGKVIYYPAKLINAKGNPLKNKAVKFTFNGKNTTVKTGSNGIAKLKLGILKSGNYKVSYSYDYAKGTSTVHVVGKVSIKQIVSASKYIRSFVEKHHKLPSTVKMGKIRYSTADYLYLASKAIVNLKANKKVDITYKPMKNPSKPGAAQNKGNLYKYLTVAKSIVKTGNSNGKMPNYVSSSVGNIGYKGIVYAFSRLVAYYGNHGEFTSYISIKSLSSSSYTSISKLDSKNTISNLAAYLAASTNCQVDNAKIKQLVTKLTKGCTSDEAKARAIYNYVRDTISYSFYYDTKYGAVGTLNAKTGNCVDHSHLLVAMYRTADLPARYVHGTCTFSSGTYGHVWTQVLIGDTWVVSDATSPRNSFGKVVNWNENSYSLKGYYSSISF